MSAPTVVPGAPACGRIGPNAIVRVAESLPAHVGPTTTQVVFEAAGLAHYLHQPPGAMVDEVEVRRLNAALRRELGWPLARTIAREAGTRTARYLLARRIPRPVQSLLRCLPAAAASRVLVAAIARHAWTFAGSGEFTARAGRPLVLTIRRNPLCVGVQADEPACDFYAATFEGLFRALVRPRARVVETACMGQGAPACVFEVCW